MKETYRNEPDTQASKREALRQSRATWISAFLGAAFTVVSAIIFVQSPGGTAWYEMLVRLVPVALAAACFFSAWLAWSGRTTAAGIFLLTLLFAASLTIPVIGNGQGLAVGALIAVLGIGITAMALPQRHSVRGNTISLLTGATVILLDQVVPDFGLPSEPIYTNVFALVVSVVFVIIIIRQFHTFTLRAKMVIAFTAITLIPLVVLGAYINYVSTQELEGDSQEKLTALSEVVKKTADSFLTDQQDIIRTEAKQAALADYLLLPPQARQGSIEEQKAQGTLLAFQRKDPVFIDSYSLLYLNGKALLSTSAEDKGRDESAEPYFTEVIGSGEVYFSNVRFVEEGEASIYFSAAIRDAGNKVIGVLRAEYHATVMQNLARSVAPSNPGIIISLVDQTTYLRIAYTGKRDRLFKSYKQFSPEEVAELQAQGQLPPGAPDEVLAGTDDAIVAGIDRIGKSTAPQFFDAYSGSLGSNAVNTGTVLKNQPWVALVRESYASNRGEVEKQRRDSVLISLGLAGVAVLLGLVSAQILGAPIAALTKVTDQIAAGDINARAQVSAQDEIGNLATAFNRMADELNATLNSLEERVSERTADLEATKRQSDKRAGELQAIGEISKIITGEQKLEILFPLITRLVSERFGFYHTGIFLVNETRQFAVLQAANSEGGRRMLERGHRLEFGYGIVGYVAKTGVYRIALDVGMDSAYFNNPDLPTTRSEMALPLKIRNVVIGVLDVQSEMARAFTENDARNLSILTDQIAIALENARLFERTQQALNEAQMLYRQNVQEGWLAFSRQEETVGYRQTMKGGEKLKDPVDSDEIREALNRGTALHFNAEGERESYIVIPVKLRGQVIGVLNVKAPVKGRQWTSDEINFTESIAERLSIALENARLIQESQRQVMKQQTIHNVTERISGSINLKNVLQTAVEELGRVMPGSEVILKLTSRDSHKEDPA